MKAFYAELKLNIRRRMTDGFAVGYNIVFPIMMVFLLGTLSKWKFEGEITSIQYYSIVVMPFCILMGIVTAAYAGKDDAYAKVAQRVLVSPVTKEAIVMSKIISCTIVFSICNVIVLGVMAFFFQVSISNSLLAILSFFMCISFFISTLGTLIGLSMKHFLTIKNVLTIPICVFGILGGTFFPMGHFEGDLKILINLSPLTWINRSLFLSLYDRNSSLLWWITFVLAVGGMVCTCIAITAFQKEEYLYGDLPSNEK